MMSKRCCEKDVGNDNEGVEDEKGEVNENEKSNEYDSDNMAVMSVRKDMSDLCERERKVKNEMRQKIDKAMRCNDSERVNRKRLTSEEDDKRKDLIDERKKEILNCLRFAVRLANLRSGCLIQS